MLGLAPLAVPQLFCTGNPVGTVVWLKAVGGDEDGSDTGCQVISPNLVNRYFYCWDELVKRDGQAEYQRHQVYVPVRAIAQVQAMIAERQPVAVVLNAIKGAEGKQ